MTISWVHSSFDFLCNTSWWNYIKLTAALCCYSELWMSDKSRQQWMRTSFAVLTKGESGSIPKVNQSISFPLLCHPLNSVSKCIHSLFVCCMCTWLYRHISNLNETSISKVMPVKKRLAGKMQLPSEFFLENIPWCTVSLQHQSPVLLLLIRKSC